MYWLGGGAKDCVDLDDDLDAEYTAAMNSASLSASGCAGAALYRVCGYRLPIVLVGAGTAWRNGLPTEWISYREPCMKSEQERKSDCGQVQAHTRVGQRPTGALLNLLVPRVGIHYTPVSNQVSARSRSPFAKVLNSGWTTNSAMPIAVFRTLLSVTAAMRSIFR
jgi:hypothetical protein